MTANNGCTKSKLPHYEVDPVPLIQALCCGPVWSAFFAFLATMPVVPNSDIGVRSKKVKTISGGGSKPKNSFTYTLQQTNNTTTT